jgi:DmsE family decaheme c-type cytochrome
MTVVRVRSRCGRVRRLMAVVAIVLFAMTLAGTRPVFAVGPGPVASISGQGAGQASGSAGQENCATCHADAVQQLAAHPHARGAQQVHCADCHTPHGNPPRKKSQSTAEQNARCTACHRETAGPFAYEHPPVKVEGCVSCHAPHGAQDANFLLAGGVPTLCLQCHAIGKTSLHAHDISPAGLVRNRSGEYVPCTRCHSHIHGSNLSDVFFK